MKIKRIHTANGNYKPVVTLDDEHTTKAYNPKGFWLSGYNAKNEHIEVELSIAEIKIIAEIYNEGKFAEIA